MPSSVLPLPRLLQAPELDQKYFHCVAVASVTTVQIFALPCIVLAYTLPVWGSDPLKCFHPVCSSEQAG